MKKPTGRPTIYTEELGDEICAKLSVSPVGIQKLAAQNEHWPCFQTIYEWRLKHKSFGEKYAEAKSHQVEVYVDQCLEIADDVSNDTVVKVDKDGNEYQVQNSEWMNRSRLRIDTRKWYASKIAPKIYGDRVYSENKHDVTVEETTRKVRDADSQYEY